MPPTDTEGVRVNETASETLTVYVAGDYADAKRLLRGECNAEGLCVTLTATCFVYTHGAEDGVAVGFVNYPRFPKPPGEIWGRAVRVAIALRDGLGQRTALVVGASRTLWLPAEGAGS